MLHLFRIALAMLLLGSLSACMKPSDLADGAEYYLRDAGVLDHSASQRSNNRRIQADSFIYIGQGPFVPPGYRYARPNVVAEQAFEGFVEYFPLVRRAKAPLGLDDAMREARAAGAHYLLYCRFARATTGSATGRSGKTKRNSAGSGAIAVSSRSC
ncbi:lipoprotein [Pseudomonas aeruginosa]|nr:lipoprotein [Pseudomonas aeruginosa]